jgi:hypothetical protein
MDVLAPWRDLSLVWLGLLAMIAIAIPGVPIFFAVKYLRLFKRWLRNPMLNAQVWALRIQQGTTRTTDSVASVVINFHTNATRITAATRGVINYLLGK